ncbi:TPA: hypothetical protein KFM62_005274 [Escherichia coli]|nr:hypothetical protein [Escherichia coli]HBC9557937.1 hypothetical protein [Escherichia coli]
MSEKMNNMLKVTGERIVKAIPYVAIVSGVVVWSYLNSIGRVDIFPDVISFSAGLISILISTTIFALAISITLIVPSSVLIFARSSYEKNTDAESVLRKQPAACLILSVLYLCMIYIPFIPTVDKFLHGYKPGMIKITIVIFILSFSFVFLTLMRNFAGSNNTSRFKNSITFVWHTIINTIVTVGAILSISIPISFLMQSSKGENSLAIIFALIFMAAFAFLAFFPAIIYFVNVEKAKTKLSILSTIHQLSFATVGVVLLTFLFFPNLSTMFIYSSLNAIGMVSKIPHFYMVNGEKYKPAMFYKEAWDTRVLSCTGENFYIKGVNVFSVESKNLICPVDVVKVRDETYQRDYVSFIPSTDKNKIDELKKRTRDCLILEDGDIQQWDALFDEQGKVKM